MSRRENVANICSEDNWEVFEWTRNEAFEYKHLIQGNCLIKRMSLIVLYDSGAIYLLIDYDCVERLRLPMSHLSLGFSMATSTSLLLTTILCVRIITLKKIDVILEMD